MKRLHRYGSLGGRLAQRRWWQIWLVSLLLGQFLQPLPAAWAAPAARPVAQITAPTADPKLDLPMPDVTPLPLATGPWTVQTVTPTLPVAVALVVDHPVLTPTTTAWLTFTVTSQSATPVAALTLALTLPPGLHTAAGQTGPGQTGTLTWPVDALDAGASLTQTVAVQVDAAALTSTPAVLTVAATVQTPGAEPRVTTILVGVTGATGATEATQTGQGVVLQDETTGVLLLVPPAAAPAGLTVAYTPLYNALTSTDTVTATPTGIPTVPPTPTPTVTPPATLTPTLTPVATVPAPTQTPTVTVTPPPTPTMTPVATAPAATQLQLYFPILSKDGQPGPQAVAPARAEQATSTTPVDAPARAAAANAAVANVAPGGPLTPRAAQNVAVYAIWQLTARQGATPVTTFADEVQLVVSARPWLARGVDPAQLSLWTREREDEPWQPVPTDYDASQQRFTAWLPHFSQFTLAEALTSADQLPSVRAFTTDRTTGGATLQLPLETPKGLGGLAPTLSLTYASVGIDDLYREGGELHLQTQASGVGLGWEVGGISRIVRADSHLDGDTPFNQREYVLTLNGTFVRIHYQDNAWRTDPEIFAQIDRNGSANGGRHDYAQWVVRTADGLVYTFGDGNVAEKTFNASSATATYAQRQKGGAYEKLAKQWYLVSVQDRLGNQMLYRYQAEQGVENGCIPSGQAYADLRWYVRAIYPTEILWSGHPSTDTQVNVAPKLRARFVYAATDREDWNIENAGENDCHAVSFAKRNQLTAVEVAAQDASTQWQTIRSYTLTQGYANFPLLRRPRLLLTAVAEAGKDGHVLRQQTFTYRDCPLRPARCFAGINGVRLSTVIDSGGGALTYTYTGYRISAANSVCNNHCLRYPVTTVNTNDGLGNQTRTTYDYGPPNQRGGEWGAVSDAGEFLGFRRSQATYYETNAPSVVVKWDAVDTWQGDRTQPDPRRGRLQRQEVRNGPGGTILAATVNDWRAYRRLNGDWDSQPTDRNTHEENHELIYDTLWVRLESTSAWTAGAGTWTKNFYERAQQNGQQFGNLTRVEEWSSAEPSLLLGNEQGTEAGTWAYRVKTGQQLQLLRTTVTDYFPNPALPLTNQPARVRVYRGAFDPTQPLQNCLAETRTVYDNLAGSYTSAPTVGLVAKTQQALAACSTTAAVDMHDPQWQETRFFHDVYGNPTVQHQVGGGDATDSWLNTAYDNVYHHFPVRQWLGQAPTFQATATYYGVNGPALTASHAYWGAIAEYCALNQLCTRQSYDEWGRRLFRWDAVTAGSAWGAEAAASVRWDYRNPLTNPGFTTTAITEWHAPRCTGNFVRQLYNGLGQLVAEQKPDQDWTITTDNCPKPQNLQEIETLYGYNALGQQNHASIPYRTAEDWVRRIAVVPWQSLWTSLPNTTTTYDALGRPLRQTAPNGEQTAYTYAGRTSALWGIDRQPGGYNKVLKRNDLDGLGQLQLIRTYFWTGSTLTQDAVETLTHDVTGNLTRVEHANGLGVTTLSYDLAGHKTRMTDPDLGTWTYTYDRQGNLTQQVDACGNTTTLRYEPILQRLSSQQFAQGNTGCSTLAPAYSIAYTYDGAPSYPTVARGQLTQVRYSDNSYAKAWAYNAQGLLASTTLTVSGTSYTTQLSYDADQRPVTTQEPSGEVLTTGYNSMGLPNQLASLLPPATTPQLLVSGVLYDEANRLTSATFPAGGNLVRTQRYAPWHQQDSTGGQLDGLRVMGSQGPLLQLRYAYDSFGNLQQINDKQAPGETVSPFIYDAQNRVTNAYTQTYSYDPAGRLTTYEDNRFAYATTPPHAVKTVNLPGSTSSAHTLTVRAMGAPAGGVWPQLDLWVNGAKVTSWPVTGTWQNYTATVPLTGRDRIDVVFANDGFTGSEDRNLAVAWVQVDNQAALPYTRAVYDRGDGAAAFDDNDVLAGPPTLFWNGALRFVVGAGAQAYGYDRNGNRSYALSASQTDVYTYTVTNQLYAILRNGAKLERYRYDETGQRYLRQTPTTITTYVNPDYEVTNGVATTYYSFNGQHIAMRKNGVLTYLHADHLGSTLFATDNTGTVIGNNQPRYLAYGRERMPSLAALPTDYTFTGQKQDGSGLVYMNARYYDPVVGQFISPDSIVPDPTNLFAYNRYMYVNGNPLRYTDPTGHDGFEGICTYCRDEEGSGAPDRGDGSAFHLSGVDSRALQAEAAADAARQANAAKNGGVVNRIGNFFKWLFGLEETQPEPQSGNQVNAVSTPVANNSKDIANLGKFRGPAAKAFDWEHIYERHSDLGTIAKQRTTGTVFEGLSESQIQGRVKAAWNNRELMETQADLVSGISRMRYRGVDPVSGQTVEMWYNTATGTVETAYPIKP